MLVEVDEGDVRSFARERDSHGPPNPAITSRDQRYFILQLVRAPVGLEAGVGLRVHLSLAARSLILCLRWFCFNRHIGPCSFHRPGQLGHPRRSQKRDSSQRGLFPGLRKLVFLNFVSGFPRERGIVYPVLGGIMATLRSFLGSGLAAGLLLAIQPVSAEVYSLIVKGKVTMPDGTPPPFSVGIERICSDLAGSA